MSRASFNPRKLAPPPPAVHGVHMKMNGKLHREIKELCSHHGVSFTKLVESLLTGWRDRQGGRK
jgi:hypothetical protein